MKTPNRSPFIFSEYITVSPGYILSCFYLYLLLLYLRLSLLLLAVNLVLLFLLLTTGSCPRVPNGTGSCVARIGSLLLTIVAYACIFNIRTALPRALEFPSNHPLFRSRNQNVDGSPSISYSAKRHTMDTWRSQQQQVELKWMGLIPLGYSSCALFDVLGAFSCAIILFLC